MQVCWRGLVSGLGRYRWRLVRLWKATVNIRLPRWPVLWYLYQFWFSSGGVPPRIAYCVQPLGPSLVSDLALQKCNALRLRGLAGPGPADLRSKVRYRIN